jgi:Tfp pilus assembly protein PilV
MHSPRCRGSLTHVFSSPSGATLLEVLLAIFVTGIGLLALVTLFPSAP